MINSWNAIPDNLSLDDLDQIQIINERDPQKIVAVRIGLMCSLFIRESLNPANRLALAQCGDHYQQLAGEHLKSYIKPDGTGKAKPYPPQGIHFSSDCVMQQDNIAEKSFLILIFFGDVRPLRRTHPTALKCSSQ
ncbi:hypothetical protein P4S72_03605 [Vibrio sp. PP-XX7]